MKAPQILVVALVACLCLSACSQQPTASNSTASGISQSDLESQSSNAVDASSVPEQEAEDSGLLSADEIAGIFKDLDTRSAEIVNEWCRRDYSQIPIDGVPTHILENAVIGARWIDDGCGFESIYGTAVFAKVTEETLPGFPWKSTDEIYDAITDIYLKISTNDNLSALIVNDPYNQPNDQMGIFYQFDDGLYFRTGYKGSDQDSIWDYSTMEILENTPDKVQVKMYKMDNDSNPQYSRSGGLRTIQKNTNGNWVIAGKKTIFREE